MSDTTTTPDICVCCEGRGSHSVHFNPGGWRQRPCVLCESTGKVAAGMQEAPEDDKALLVIRRRCATLHFGLDRPEVTKWGK